ncbi:MAG: hypothetical protein ACOCQ4_02035 [bacterium]
MSSVYSFKAPQYKIAPQYVPLAAPNQELVKAGIEQSSESSDSEDRNFTAYYGMADEANMNLRAHRQNVKKHIDEAGGLEEYQNSENYQKDMQKYHGLITQIGEMQARTQTLEEAYKKFDQDQLTATATKDGFATDETGRVLTDKEFNEGKTSKVYQSQQASKAKPLYLIDKDRNKRMTEMFIPDAANTEAKMSDLVNNAVRNIGYDKLKNIKFKNKDGETFSLPKIISEEKLMNLGDGGMASVLRQYGLETKENVDQLRNALSSAKGDLNRKDYAQLFLDQKRQGVMRSLPKIEKDKKGNPVYDEKGNIKYVQDEDGNLDYEQRPILSQNDFNYWADDIIASGIDSKIVNEQGYNVTSTNVDRKNSGSGSDPDGLNIYDALSSTNSFKELFETGTGAGGTSKFITKTLKVAGINDDKRAKIANDFIRLTKDRIQEFPKKFFKKGSTLDDISGNLNNPLELSKHLTEEGMGKLRSFMDGEFKNTLKNYLNNGKIGEGEVSNVLEKMTMGEDHRQINSDNWEKIESSDDLSSMTGFGHGWYKNSKTKQTISEEEYESMVAQDKASSPVNHIDVTTKMQKDIAINNYNGVYYAKTGFHQNNLSEMNVNMRYLNNQINSQQFEKPAYPMSSSQAVTGLREDGKQSTVTGTLVHKDDLKKLKGHIFDHKGEKVEMDPSKDEEKLKIQPAKKVPHLPESAKKEDDYYYVPGIILDYNPFKEKSVDEDGYMPEANRNDKKTFFLENE